MKSRFPNWSLLSGVIVLCLAAIVLSACGSDSDSGSTVSGTDTSQTTDTQTTDTTMTDKTTTNDKKSSGGSKTASAEGKKVFTEDCGSCHTMSAAGTSGNVGPNLDQLKPDEAEVMKQVENGGGGMPAFKGQLSQAQIDAVSQYVASNAGK